MISQNIIIANLKSVLSQIHSCTLCSNDLPYLPRPVLQAHSAAKILILGQAPGLQAHLSGKPFDDKSGERLRHWMGVSKDTFYNERQIAILPMGFCYPGKGSTGDLPPKKECAPTWHTKLLLHLTQVEITLVIGRYAQVHQFGSKHLTLTKCVKDWQSYGPHVIPLPHPSPLNNRWLSKNPWFNTELIPELREKIKNVLR